MVTSEQKTEIMISRAVEYFDEGFSCAECVLKAFIDCNDNGCNSDIIELASGLNGGINRVGYNTCGALVAACMAVGTTKGNKGSQEKPTVQQRHDQLTNDILPAFADVSNGFREVFESSICEEMCKGLTKEEKKSICTTAVAVAAELAARKIYLD